MIFVTFLFYVTNIVHVKQCVTLYLKLRTIICTIYASISTIFLQIYLRYIHLQDRHYVIFLLSSNVTLIK